MPQITQLCIQDHNTAHTFHFKLVLIENNITFLFYTNSS